MKNIRKREERREERREGEVDEEMGSNDTYVDHDLCDRVDCQEWVCLR